MRIKSFGCEGYGFSGRMYIPSNPCDTAVLVVTGGEQSLMPSYEVAEKFAQNGFTAVSAALFGKDGLPCDVSEIPLEMLENTAWHLKKMGYKVAVYGMSMGSIFAAYAGIFIDKIDKVILVSPSHISFEGVTADRKYMTGCGVITWRGEEMPFGSADLTGSRWSMNKGMFHAFKKLYKDKEKERAAAIPVDKINADVLMLASDRDESWPAAYSVKYMERRLKKKNFKHSFKAVIYRNSGHLIGITSLREKHPVLYALMPILYITERRRSVCEKARRESEAEIFAFLGKDDRAEVK